MNDFQTLGWISSQNFINTTIYMVFEFAQQIAEHIQRLNKIVH